MPNHPKIFRGLFSLIYLLISLGLLIVVTLSCVKEDLTEGCIKEGKRYGVTNGLFQGK